MSKSQKQRCKKSRNPVRKRAVKRSFLQLNSSEQDPGPSHALDSETVPISAPTHSGTASSAHAATHGRAEKAAWAAATPKLKRELSNEIRKRKEAEKAQRKRDRDVDDRVKLNNVLPQDRRATGSRPGLDVVRRAAEYIPEVESALQAALQRNEELERRLAVEAETRAAVDILLSVATGERIGSGPTQGSSAT
ncbi:hypothetical protein DENSPDRAFT_851854 [Dentipellis sp. KUC8613]|nr:hypothetical protein DENSPDRAFT_851854 [Dentipellis sp. KUC8613]